MKIPFIAAILLLCNAEWNIDNACEVIISSEGSVEVSVSSNPTTGYSWYIDQSSLGPLYTDNLEGNYTPNSTDVVGSGGTQTFTISCTIDCKYISAADVQFYLKRSWEPDAKEYKCIYFYITQ
ncbi:unnamed protein product [Blepharisma stoltei]|uniref:Proteinase inhibitor I42 chagasin domain-containing protein n=1 Tax=Blepharisma stoltei TaxID=1481888 RepID=A0AAU9KHU1_9CILI|nr:unnamed protein product [Blepharisma stoltei]